MKARHKMGGGGGFKREKIVERNIKGKKQTSEERNGEINKSKREKEREKQTMMSRKQKQGVRVEKKGVEIRE